MNTQIEFTRVNNDTNGNPRYVCHFLNLLTAKETEELRVKNDWKNNIYSFDLQYNLAIKKAKTIGGKKFHNKQYGGGIVFQSYNLHDLEKDIIGLLK